MDPTPGEITALADELNSLATKVTGAQTAIERKQQTAALVLQAKQLIAKVQDPFDALMDHIVNVRSSCGAIRGIIEQMAIDFGGKAYIIGACLTAAKVGIFEAIPAHGTVTVKQVADRCNVAEEFITRLMRQLTCNNIFDEVKVGEYAHNRLSFIHSEHAGAFSGKRVYQVALDEMAPAMLRLNHYLDTYRTEKLLSTYTDTPHSWYYNLEGKNFWEVLTSTPGRMENFIRGLSLFEVFYPVVAIFPFEKILRQGNSSDRPLMVDVGGGKGLALLDMRKGCPDLKGELVLQDLHFVIDHISSDDLPGVKKMAHDFFQEQPVQNAQLYYIRRVLHDWQDDDAVRVLQAIKPAMGKDSRIVVSEMAMPEPATLRDTGAVWMDLMMLSIGGKERTVRDWEKLADLSGLKCMKVWQEPEKFGPLCAVEYMLPDGEGVSA